MAQMNKETKLILNALANIQKNQVALAHAIKEPNKNIKLKCNYKDIEKVLPEINQKKK